LAKDLLFSSSYKMAKKPSEYLTTPGWTLPPRSGARYPPFFVKTSGPFSVTAMVFSKCAERDPSAV
jgi:hypothetical protein